MESDLQEPVFPVHGSSFLKKIIILFFITVIFNHSLFPQSITNTSRYQPFFPKCGELPLTIININAESRGYAKPERTDYTLAASDAYFPVLIVFVQFANDPGPQVSYWPRSGNPSFMNSLISQTKKYPAGDNWWDTYSAETELISDFWLEQSRGHLHVIGSVYSIVLDYDYQYYMQNGGLQRVNDHIYQKLNSLFSIDWRNFDRWAMLNGSSSNYFDDVSDGYIDMIYKVFRSHAPIPDMPDGGVASLGESYSQGMDYLIDTTYGIQINGGFGDLGSGITLTPGYGGTIGTENYSPYQPLTKKGMASFSGHEHGHYLFGPGHGNYGKMMAEYGPDECLSPWESAHLGYMETKKADFRYPEYLLGDFSSRTKDPFGEIIQVSIADSTEYFLISNRRKVSDYDRIMWGDTARGDIYRQINPEYGKGVYIYHVRAGNIFPAEVDQECADGLFSWAFSGSEYPDWSNEQLVPYYIRTQVAYGNDLSSGMITAADGKSMLSWFGLGQKHQCLNCDGTDRIFTNKKEVWTSRELAGDRWDGWNVGYNEVFSPYSSPSTCEWHNEPTGIFIWLYELNESNNQAKFRIYKADDGGFTEEDILLLTPPSRPMGLNATLSECSNSLRYPVITWLHSMEPDMINYGTHAYEGKQYNIYRAISQGDAVPAEYNYLTTVNLDAAQLPRFIDYQLPINCQPEVTINARYVVTAVDNTGAESVESDFDGVTVNSFVSNGIPKGELTPQSFRLYQNYPNPFNPKTMIKYDIPTPLNPPEGGKPVLVTFKVYDVLGKEIYSVSEFKFAGSYEVSFDGSNYASGMYFYRIQAGDYADTKKMLMIK